MRRDTANVFLMGLTDVREGMERLHANWGWALALGAVLTFFGILCLAAAGVATLTSVVFFGTLLAISGAMQIIHAFSFRFGHGFLLNLLVGLLYTVVGVLMWARPGVGALSLTLLASSFFLVGGIFRCVWSAMMRYPSWGWAFFSGVITAGLGLYIAANLPTAAIWLIGTFVGVEMLLSGWSWMMLAFAARSYVPSRTGQTDNLYPRRAS